jgi:translation initiation factor IF-3
VIDGTTNAQLGVLRTEEALRKAKSMGLDLVEIAPQATPPVCRIVDYGKFRYEQSKQEKERKHNSANKVKEIKFRVNIDQHDYVTKLRRGEEFLDKGNKLKLVLQFRGRENAHKELGLELMHKIKEDLSSMGHADMEPKLVGRAVSMTMSPLPAHKRKRRFAPLKDEELEELEKAEIHEDSHEDHAEEAETTTQA